VLGDARAVDLLITALADRGVSVRAEAASALGVLGDARAVDPLIAALADRGAYVSTNAARALSQFGDLALVPLTAALANPDKAIRYGAVIALKMLDDVQAVNPLITALGDLDRRVRSSAAEALTRIGTPEALAAVDAWRKGRAGRNEDVL
jgi:HEAT repeat protein